MNGCNFKRSTLHAIFHCDCQSQVTVDESRDSIVWRHRSVAASVLLPWSGRLHMLRSRSSDCVRWLADRANKDASRDWSQLLYLLKKLFILVDNSELGSLKLKYTIQSWIIDILFVLNSFIKKRLTAKSNERMSDFFKQQASVPYIKIGKHLLAMNQSGPIVS